MNLSQRVVFEWGTVAVERCGQRTVEEVRGFGVRRNCAPSIGCGWRGWGGRDRSAYCRQWVRYNVAVLGSLSPLSSSSYSFPLV